MAGVFYRNPGMPQGDERLEVSIHEDIRCDGWVVEWRSYRYHFQGGIRLARNWNARGCDPRAVEGVVRELWGRTLDHFERIRLPDIQGAMQAIDERLQSALRDQIARYEYEGGYRDQFAYINAFEGAHRRLRHGEYAYGMAPQTPTPESLASTKKARDLLLSQLNPEQRAAFEQTECFTVIGKDKKAYVIRKGRSFNVTGPDGTKYCGTTPDAPLEDQMLAQKLLLENEPEKFFKNANSSGGQTRMSRAWMA